MKRVLLTILVFIISTIAFAQNPIYQNIINQISLDSLKLYNRQLSGDTSCIIGGQTYTIVSRHKLQPANNMAAQFILEKFQSFGLTAEYETFSTTGANVIATKLGVTYPNRYWVVCAHFDDMPSGTTAPGADDNASGTSAVLEIARVFSKYTFDYTIKFMAFDEEEQGLVGSNYTATQARNRNDSIMGVLNMDMIAYDNNNDGKLDVHSKAVANTQQIANDFIANITEYAIGLVPRLVASQPYSDHDSFLKKNYGAILLIEDDNEFNPRYHTVNDKVQYNNFPYMTNITKAVAVTAAEYAVIKSGVSVNFTTADGWNLLSVPVLTGDMRKTTLFPTSTSLAYTYEGLYVDKNQLQVGRGYWLKFSGEQEHSMLGNIETVVNVPVQSGWNLIGALWQPISVVSITTTPPNIINSQFYEYNNGYSTAATLIKGKGYWVSVTQDGTIRLSTTQSKDPNQILNLPDYSRRIIFIDSHGHRMTLYLDETRNIKGFTSLPPTPPTGVFDIRFASGKYIEDANKENLILLNSIEYPLTITYESKFNSGIELLSSIDLNGIKAKLENNQSITLNQPISSLMVRNITTPMEFTLFQNYPNPFNSQTTVKFSLPSDGNVELSVYNSIGQEVKNILKQWMNSGYYEVYLDSKDLASGIYYFNLKFNEKLAIKKAILLK